MACDCTPYELTGRWGFEIVNDNIAPTLVLVVEVGRCH
jgi:hypothetical protein